LCPEGVDVRFGPWYCLFVCCAILCCAVLCASRYRLQQFLGEFARVIAGPYMWCFLQLLAVPPFRLFTMPMVGCFLHLRVDCFHLFTIHCVWLTGLTLLVI
jgi:hypothetical protein